MQFHTAQKPTKLELTSTDLLNQTFQEGSHDVYGHLSDGGYIDMFSERGDIRVYTKATQGPSLPFATGPEQVQGYSIFLQVGQNDNCAGYFIATLCRNEARFIHDAAVEAARSGGMTAAAAAVEETAKLLGREFINRFSEES